MTIEPRIEYITTDDGVSLACTKFGKGPPVIMHYSGMISNFEMELAFPGTMLAYEELSRITTVIRYDFRNTGLSTRGVKDVSIEAHMRDLDAVYQHFQLESAVLLFPYTTTRVAVEYVAARPERVNALILPYPELDAESSIFTGEVSELLNTAGRLGWEVLASVMAVVLMGLEAHAHAAWYARYLLETTSLADLLRGGRSIVGHDARPAAAQVRCPTLLLHRRLPAYNAGPASTEMIRAHRANIPRLSSAIPGAQSAIFEGSSAWFMNDELMVARIVEFLGEVQAKQAETAASFTFLGHFIPPVASNAASPVAADPSATALRTVLFTDLVGHTEMMSRLGDERGRDVLREHERITREVLKANGGVEVKTMGDGFMASFGSVTKAVEAAIELQRTVSALTPDPSPAATGEGQPALPLKVRCGLNAGEPIEEDGDLFGATVILASRIAAKAEGGEILVADTVRGLCSGKGFLFADRGEFVAKGFEEPVRVYEVSWRE